MFLIRRKVLFWRIIVAGERSSEMFGEEECESAYINPKCPYVTMINQHSTDIHQIKNALVGDDLQSGLVAKLQRLETFMKVSVFIAGASVVALIGLALKLIFGV